MSILRKHIVFRIVWVFMALHILNCSIDSPDAQPDYVPENLSYNDIESVAELIIEQIMGFDNIIPEQDEHDTEDGGSISIAKILFYCQPFSIFSLTTTEAVLPSAERPIHYRDTYASQFHPEIVPPPPKEVAS